MRTIKFRIWNPVEKKMVESGGTPSMLSGFFHKTATLDTVHNMPYQQFTGLLDKSGKEIYEGDIVSYGERVARDLIGEGDEIPFSIDGFRNLRPVLNLIYADGHTGVRIFGDEIKTVEWKGAGFEPFSDSDDNCGHCGGGDNPKNVEVIGNIYENPELLKS